MNGLEKPFMYAYHIVFALVGKVLHAYIGFSCCIESTAAGFFKIFLDERFNDVGYNIGCEAKSMQP